MNVVHDEDSTDEEEDPAGAARAGGDGHGGRNGREPKRKRRRNNRQQGRRREELLAQGNENLLAVSLKANELGRMELRCRTLMGRCTDPHDVMQAMLNLAAVLQRQGRLEEAETLLRQGLHEREQLLGVDHQHTMQTRQNLAELLDSRGKLKESEVVWRQTSKGYEQVLGRNHSQTLEAMYKLSVCLEAQSKTEEAETLYRETLDRYQNSLGLIHPNALACVSGLALLLLCQGRLQESEPLLREAADRCRSVFGPDHPDTLAAMHNLVCLLSRQGNNEEAAELAKEGLESSLLNLGQEHHITKLFQKHYSADTSMINSTSETEAYPESRAASQASKDTSNDNECIQLATAVAHGDMVATVPFAPEEVSLAGPQFKGQKTEPNLEHGHDSLPREAPASSFEDWLAKQGGERTLEQELVRGMELWNLAENGKAEAALGGFEDLAASVAKDLEKIPICGVDSIVTKNGIHLGWFLDVFCGTPYMQMLIEFGCQMWFVRKVCIIEIIRQVHFTTSKTHNDTLPSGSFLDFADAVVEGFGVQGDVGEIVKRATTFISYNGGSTLREMLEVLRQLDSNEYVWIDFLCVNQFCFTGKPETFELQQHRVSFLGELQRQINSINNTVLVLEKWDNVMQTLGQDWVLWEVFCSAESGAGLRVLLPEQQSKDFVENCLESSDKFESIIASVSSIDASKARAKNDSDHQAVCRKIEVAGLSKVNSLAACAVRDWMQKEGRQRLEEMRNDPKGPGIVFLNNLARLFQDHGKPREAEPLCREALDLQLKLFGPQQPGSLVAMNNLASLFRDMGKFGEAEVLYREALERSRSVFGLAHPETITYTNNLACLLENQGKIEEAVPLHREALEKRLKVLGPNHPSTLNSMDNLAGLLRSLGLLEEAEPLLREALVKKQEVLGPDHPETLRCLDNLSRLLQSSGRLEEAEPLCREALQKRQKVLGPDHSESLHSLNSLACMLHDQGRLEETETLYREILERRNVILGPDHPETLTSINNLACLLENQGRLGEAEPMHREALRKRQKVLGPDHPSTRNSMNNLVGLLQSRGVSEKSLDGLFKSRR